MKNEDISDKNENLAQDRDTTDSKTPLIVFDEEDNSFLSDDKKRNIIFIVLVAIATLSSLDGGIIPQQNEEIKKDFGGEDEKKVGLFGSIDYVGRVIGSIIFTLIMSKMNRKYMLVITLIFKAITLVIPIIDYNNYILNLIVRALSGISQVFYPTYLPVWCDQFAKKKNKSIWVTIVQIGNPIGIILGYGLGMISENILFSAGWVNAFFFEGIFLAACALIIIFFDKMYFSEKFILIDDTKGKETVSEQKEVRLFKDISKILFNKIFFF